MACSIYFDYVTFGVFLQGDLISTGVVEMLRARFNSLLQVGSVVDPSDPSAAPVPPPPQTLTQGQVLLALLSAPFAKVEAAIWEFVAKMEQLSVPSQWRKVDVIQEAKKMQVSRGLVRNSENLTSKSETLKIECK